ncbi:MAG TPA: hypothetical protein VLL50_07640 [Usitatibacter sp.]|nr:hypothetical protein [Usitatibacter sp.]
MIKLLTGIALIAMALASSTAGAQPAGPGSTPLTSIVGSFSVNRAGGGGYSGTFSCLGTPQCNGIYTRHDNPFGCANTYVHTESFRIDGLNLASNGTSSATVTLSGLGQVASVGAGQVCTFNDNGGSVAYNISIQYKAGSATFTSPLAPDPANWLYGSFSTPTANPPVFPMDVFGDLRPNVVSGAVAVKVRPQDLNVPQNIYVFAHAPSNLVHAAHAAKRDPADHATAIPADDAIVCVLAQVDATGNLVAASASTMQAAIAGVRSSQAQAQNLLNSVATGNVAGAIMFVGYGPDAQSMLSNGIYQAALEVTGPVQCTSSLALPPAPKNAGPLTGLWWNPGESGWGVHFTQRGSNVFAAWYTYDASGRPKWYVAPNCVGMSGTGGTCNGTLYEVNGPTFFGTAFNPGLANVVNAGTLQVTYTDANNGSMTYTVGSNTRTVPIARQPIAAGTSTAVVDYSDLWWNPNESGWGMAMAQQNANIFLAWYVYDGAGKPTWYVASNCTVSGSSCSGPLYATTGPPFGPTFDSSLVRVAAAGSVIVSFVDANNAVLSYTVGGVTATKTITRQIF